MLVKYLMTDRTKHLKDMVIYQTPLRGRKTKLETITNATIMLLANVQGRLANCRFLRRLQVPHHPPVM
jgi:hypothetical protein